ncbi:hypothetical protein VNO77_21231 [Canavalia gladiata]|uniref:Uncharacterized protein n=1 Tax=Canavalia gladiata TaxID=3824 RepID=A0AAN9LQN8_CANGL
MITTSLYFLFLQRFSLFLDHPTNYLSHSPPSPQLYTALSITFSECMTLPFYDLDTFSLPSLMMPFEMEDEILVTYKEMLMIGVGNLWLAATSYGHYLFKKLRR